MAYILCKYIISHNVSFYHSLYHVKIEKINVFDYGKAQYGRFA